MSSCRRSFGARCRAAAGITGLLLGLGLLGACEPQTAAEEDSTPVRVRAFVDRADVTPGKPFILTVEVDRRVDVVFDLPDVGAAIEGLVIMNQGNEPTEHVGQRELLRSTYKLKAPLSGTYLIPGVEAPWKTPDNQVGTAGTGPILIEANRAAGEEGAGEETLRDLKPAAAPDPDYRLIVLLSALAGLLALGLLWFFQRRRGRTTEAPPLAAHVLALRDLDVLGGLDLADPANHARVAYGVSAVLRRYLEARFDFAAWKMTTQEVLRSMPPELAAQRAVPGAVQEVLEASDLVKFAGADVDESTLHAWIIRARKVIEITLDQLDEQEAA